MVCSSNFYATYDALRGYDKVTTKFLLQLNDVQVLQILCIC